ncbi:MAG: hypothetical protein D6705_01095 [Deltaproteobacteria bacterium]|nr:MAG: hypothetical protein D6705_01095 [Deltaproteobacteria bacterium]
MILRPGIRLADAGVVEAVSPPGWGVPGLGTCVRLRRDDGERMVVTVLGSDLLPDGVAVSRFLMELHGLKTISHPHLVPLELLDRDAEWVFVGGPVGAGEPIVGGVDPDVEAVALGVARGLAALHRRKAVHGCLHPGAVFVDADGVAKIGQYGMWAHLSRSAYVAKMVADPNTILAPESLDAAEQVAPVVDSYGFGVVVAGAADPKGSLARSVAKAREGALPALSGPLGELVARCLSVEPGRRPEHGAALLAAVETAVTATGATTTRGRAPADVPSLSLSHVELEDVHGTGTPVEAEVSSDAMELSTEDLLIDRAEESATDRSLPSATRETGGVGGHVAEEEPPLLDLAAGTGDGAAASPGPGAPPAPSASSSQRVVEAETSQPEVASPRRAARPVPRDVLGQRTVPAGPPGWIAVLGLFLLTAVPVLATLSSARATGRLRAAVAVLSFERVVASDDPGAASPARSADVDGTGAGTEAPAVPPSGAGTTGALRGGSGGGDTAPAPAVPPASHADAGPAPTTRSTCPTGTVAVGRTVCIDRAEAPGLGRIPTTGVTHRQAAEACEGRGGRLCRKREWQQACMGPGGWNYPYGPAFADDRCNTASPAGYPQEIGIAGSWSACRTPSGIYDLVGNVGEWVAEGIAVGGDSTTDRRVASCLAEGRPPPGYAGPELGFRCCFDLSAPRGPSP